MLRGFPVALTGENDGHDDDDGDFTISSRKGVSQRYRHHRHHRHREIQELLVLVDVWINIPPKSVGSGDGYMPQRLVCLVVWMVKNND